MATGGFSSTRLVRLREPLDSHVDSGLVPGALAVLSRHGDVRVEAVGTLAFEGAGSTTPMAVDTICRLGSMTKPLVAAESGTAPIADALDTLGEPEPDEWIRRLGGLPLVHQPGERWMYNTAADVTVVLIARATGRSFGDAPRERIYEPLGMTDTAFAVSGANLDRVATAYERDDAATGEPVVEDGPDGRWSRLPVFESGGGGSSRPRTTSSPSPRLCSPAVHTRVNGYSHGRR